MLRRAVLAGLGVCAASVVGLSHPASAVGADYAWDGSVGDWSMDVHWSPGGGPPVAATDNATINSGTVTLDQSFSLGALNLGGGVITGTNNLTLAGLFGWSAGAIAGQGSMFANGGLQISGAVDHIIDSRTLVSSGAGTWSAGNIVLSNGAVLQNTATGSLVASADGSLLASGSGAAPTFVNAGVFEKSGGLGSGATLVSAQFFNSGTARVSAGNLVFSGGGSATGSFEIAAGASLVIRQDYSFGATSSITGAGTIAFESGNNTILGSLAVSGGIRLSGGSLALNALTTSTSDLVLSAGTLNGGTVTANTSTSWLAATLQNADVRANGALEMLGGDHTLSGSRFTTSGNATWSSGFLVLSNNSAFINNGTIAVTINGNALASGANPGAITNAGVIDRSGGGATTIYPLFYNSGTARASGGTLSISGGGSATGHFEALAGAMVRFSTDYTMAAGSRISGSGTVQFAGGTNAVLGTYDVSGTTEIWGGLTDFAGTITNIGSTLYLGYGMAVISAPTVTGSKLDQYGGGLDGAGTITFNDLVTWDSGPQKGAGTTIAAGGLKLLGNAKSLEGRTLVNAVGSSGTWSAGNLFGYNAAIFRNDGTLTNTGDVNFYLANGAPQFNNTGTFVKTGAAGTTSFGVEFNNSGTVRVEAGSIYLGRGSSTGHFELSGGAIELAGYSLEAGAKITGSGAAKITGVLTVNGPAVTAQTVELLSGGQISGAGNLTIQDLTWTGGRMASGSGVVAVTGTGTLGGGGKELYGKLQTAAGAIVSWTAGDITGFPGAIIDNAGTFRANCDATFYYGQSTSARFDNSGLFVKNSAGNTSFVAFFNNTGTVRVESGSLILGGGGLSSGSFELIGGAVELTGGYTLGAGTSISGTNKAKVTGNIAVIGSATATVLEQTAGTISGTGTLSIGNFAWKGGTQSGATTTTVTSTADLSGSQMYVDGRTLSIAAGATATWSAGTIYAVNSGVIQNLGTFTTNFDGSVILQTGAPAFNNAGTFIKSAGAGNTSLGIAFNNAGTARVEVGNLYLSSGTGAGHFELVGGTVELAGYTFDAGAKVTGANKAKVSGILNVAGAATAENLELLGGGQITGPGEITIQHLTWSGGRLTGSGTTTVSVDATFSGSGREIADRTLRVLPGATATWAANDMTAFPNAVIDNAGTFRATCDATLYYGVTPSAAINNSGLFLKTASAGNTALNIPFNNTGTARVESGSLILGGGGTGTGVFDLTGGTLELMGGYNLGTGATIVGPQKAKITGNVTVSGNASASLVEQTAGIISGGGTLSIGNFTWKGGTQGGGGTTRITGTGDLSGSQMYVDGRTLSVAAGATAMWSAGTIYGVNAGIVENLGTFTTNFDGSVGYQGGAPAFNNAGLFIKSAGAGNTSVSIAFNNSGTARVESGSLVLAGGGLSSGGFELTGGTLELTSGYNLGTGTSISGTNKAKVTGNVAVVGSASAAMVEQTAGAVSGTGTLSIGNFAWKGGTQGGSGGGGTTSITALGDLSGAQMYVDGRTVAVAAGATATWSAGTIFGANAGVIQNLGTFTTNFDGSVILQTGAPAFNNAGTFIKSAGAGNTSLGIAFNNAGTARVEVGNLYLSSGTGAGHFDLVGGTVELAGYTFDAGAKVTGANKAKVTGILNVAGASTAENLELLGGGQITGPGEITIQHLTWSGGRLTGSGTTTVSVDATFSGSGREIADRTLRILPGATATWAANDMTAFPNAVIDNAGTFLANWDGNFYYGQSPSALFKNSGLMVKGSPGNTSFGIYFNNSGTVRVDAGNLILGGGGTSTGQFNLVGGTLELTGNHNLGTGATIIGANKAKITGGVIVAGNASANLVEQVSGGIVSGAGTLAISEFAWKGGIQYGTGGAGITSIVSVGSLSGSELYLDGRTLSIAAGATANWASGTIYAANAGQIQNLGTLVNSFNGSIVHQSGAMPTLSNAGTFVKSAGTASTSLGIALVNTGTVRVDSGNLYLSSGTSTGLFHLPGGTVEIGGYTLDTGAAITGANQAKVTGILTIAGASTAENVELMGNGQITGPGNLTISHLTWSGGRLTGGGTTTVSVDASFTGGGREIQGRTLRVLPGAVATWASGDMSGFPGSVVDNSGTVRATGDNNFYYAQSQSAAFNNSGLFVKAGGTGNSGLSILFNNAGGTARVESGTLALSGGGVSTGGHFDLVGGTLDLSGGYTLGAGTTITGTNKARISGDIAVSGAATAQVIEHAAGNASGAGTLTAGEYSWTGGTLSGGGVTAITGTLNLAGSLKTIDGRTLRIASGALAQWNAGDLRAGNAGVLENLGTLEARSDNSFFLYDGAAPAFWNKNYFGKVAGTNTTGISVPFYNSGTVAVETGTLFLGGGGSSTGSFVLSGGVLELTGNYNLADGSAITGANKARITGNIAVTGNVSGKLVEQTGGIASGGGTFTVENFTWKGGTLGGTGTTSITSVAEFSGTEMYVDGRVLAIAPGATATWSSGILYGSNGGVIDNRGTLVNSFDGSMQFQTGARPVLENRGQFTKSGGAGGTTTVSINFNNSGTATVSAGTLRLIGGGSATGVFNIAAGCSVDLAYDYTLSGAQFLGAGQARLTGGTLGVSVDSTAGAFEQTGGTLSGVAKFSATDLVWKGGTMSGASGTTVATANLTINGADMLLSGRTLRVAAGATANWQAGDVRVSGGGTLSNAGTFDIVAPEMVSFARIDGVDAYVRNSGTFRKSVGTNVAVFPGVTLDNTGTVRVDAGTLNVGVLQFDSATQTLAGGTWYVASGGKLDLGGGPGIGTNLAHVTLDGPTATFQKINDLADNRGTFVLKNGRQFPTGSAFNNSGTVVVDASSGLLFGFQVANTGTIQSAGTTSASFIFNNAGSFNQSGPLTVHTQFTNSGSAVADISGAQTWGSGAHLQANGGTVILRSNAGSVASSTLILDASGANIELGSSQNLKGLNLNGGKVTLTPGGGKVLRTQAYSAAGGGATWASQLDVGDGYLILEYTGESIFPIVAQQLASGYNAAAATHWTGNGIMSSLAQGNQSRAVGFGESATLLGGSTTWAGQTITTPAILVRFTVAADATLDGKVDFDDLLLLAQNYNSTTATWSNADFTYDGKVDFDDLLLLAQNYNASISPAAVVAGEAGASAQFRADAARAFAMVPEPGTTTLLAAGALALLGKRRRRSRSQDAD